jgi:hypothetical protein
MNTDKLSGELFHDLMHLLDITVLPDREDVAVAYVEDGDFVSFVPEFSDERCAWRVAATHDSGDTGECYFDTEKEALKFIDALIFLGHADERAGCNV